MKKLEQMSIPELLDESRRLKANWNEIRPLLMNWYNKLERQIMDGYDAIFAHVPEALGEDGNELSLAQKIERLTKQVPTTRFTFAGELAQVIVQLPSRRAIMRTALELASFLADSEVAKFQPRQITIRIEYNGNAGQATTEGRSKKT